MISDEAEPPAVEQSGMVGFIDIMTASLQVVMFQQALRHAAQVKAGW